MGLQCCILRYSVVYIDELTVLYPKRIQWCLSMGLQCCILRYSVMYIDGFTVLYPKVFSDVHR